MLKKAAVMFLLCAGMAMWVGCVKTSSRYLYASIPQSAQIVEYREDPNSGVLTILSTSPITAGPAVQSIVVTPNKQFLYAANSGANNVSRFAIDGAGSLTEMTPRTTVGTAPNLVVMDSAGQFLYVANAGSNDIWVFQIDSSSGNLTQVGSAFQIGISPLNMKLSPSGTVLYVTGAAQLAGQPGYLETLSVNTSATPPLSLIQVTQPGSSPYGLAINPAGTSLYTANFGDNTISEFTINSDGTLTQLTGSPIGETYTGPVSLLIDKSGKYLYVANQQSSGNLAGYAIGGDGGLTLLTNSPFATGAQPSFIASDPGGGFLFVGNQSSPVVQSFRLDASSGTLTSVASYTVPGTPTSIVVSP
ncbi:MAG TPA: beta-propeller fold lactonase family protein [Candidatus Sulfotelmatobacter sp.]|nr:beta-propeller fold lactonase family protein [Candidatus Sulfotelmatobacter sp.]